MINKLMTVILSSITLISTCEALDKDANYKIINECKYLINNEKSSDDFIYGFILGLGQAYNDILSSSHIDNEFTGLKTGEFSKKMCAIALEFRRLQNKNTGGKYDVTPFISDLSFAGYTMTTPPTQDTSNSNKKD